MKKIIKLTESDLHRIVKRVINESQLLNEGVGESSRKCWYYKQIAAQKYTSDKRVPNPFEGAGGVQDFLNVLGWHITKDWDFGDETAKALAFWKYGGKYDGKYDVKTKFSEFKIDTVNKLWIQLKKDGYNVGETTGYGSKMKEAVATMILKTCKEISKTCKVHPQTRFDMDYRSTPKEDVGVKQVLLPNALNGSFKYAISYWRKYLKNPKVQQKIWDNISFFDSLSNFTLSNLMDKYFNALNNIEKKGWVDKTKEAEGATAFVGEDCPEYTVCVNMSFFNELYKSNGIKKVVARSEDTFVHEIQHILWMKVQKLNSTISIKQAFPSAYDYYGSEKEEQTIKNLSISEKIPEETKKELNSKGIDSNRLKEYFSGSEWTDGYNCDWDEKLSNLAGYRSYLSDSGTIKIGADIPLQVISLSIKDLLSTTTYKKVPSDFIRMIACWVLGGMKPKLSVFVNELNDLAQKEIKPEDKDYNNTSQIDSYNVT
jgi:hypothetical protein